MFGGFQHSIAETLGISRTIVMALQVVGGAIGNMICVHNVVAAMIYSLGAGVLGLLLIYVFATGVF